MVSPKQRTVSLAVLTVCFAASFLDSGLVWAKNIAVTESQPVINMASVREDQATRNLEAKIIINAPPAFVWKTLTNYEQLEKVVSCYKKSDIVSSSGNLKTLDISMTVSPLLPNYDYRVQVREDRSQYQIALERISGDFKFMKARYRLYPQANGAATELVYSLAIDPGARLPGTQKILKANTETTLRAIQQESQREHQKSLIGQR